MVFTKAISGRIMSAPAINLAGEGFASLLKAAVSSEITQEQSEQSPRQYLTGEAAQKKALETVAPDVPLEKRATDSFYSYSSLFDRLHSVRANEGRNKDIKVIAAYGSIIIIANRREIDADTGNEEKLANQIRKSLEKIDSTPSGHALLNKIEDKIKSDKMPWLIDVSSPHDGSQTLGSYPAIHHKLNETGYDEEYVNNFNEISFPWDDTFLLDNDVIFPPYLLLARALDVALRPLEIKQEVKRNKNEKVFSMDQLMQAIAKEASLSPQVINYALPKEIKGKIFVDDSVNPTNNYMRHEAR
jgi:hypothetical protein